MSKVWASTCLISMLDLSICEYLDKLSLVLRLTSPCITCVWVSPLLVLLCCWPLSIYFQSQHGFRFLMEVWLLDNPTQNPAAPSSLRSADTVIAFPDPPQQGHHAHPASQVKDLVSTSTSNAPASWPHLSEPTLNPNGFPHIHLSLILLKVTPERSSPSSCFLDVVLFSGTHFILPFYCLVFIFHLNSEYTEYIYNVWDP